MTTILEDDVREIKDRARRIETRLTKFFEAQGFDTRTKKPLWSNGHVHVPSLQCSLLDILMAIPDHYDQQVIISHGPDMVAVLTTAHCKSVKPEL